MSRIAKVGAVALGTGAMVLSGAGLAVADASGKAAAVGSPGFISGNVINTAVHAPVQLCASDTVTLVGALNSSFGNICKNDSDKKHDKTDKTTDKKNSKKSSKKAHHGH
jgi:hypothetical protein